MNKVATPVKNDAQYQKDQGERSDDAAKKPQLLSEIDTLLGW